MNNNDLNNQLNNVPGATPQPTQAPQPEVSPQPQPQPTVGVTPQPTQDVANIPAQGPAIGHPTPVASNPGTTLDINDLINSLESSSDDGEYAKLPAGTYLCGVDSIESKLTKAGKPMVTITYKTKEGRLIFENFPFSDEKTPEGDTLWWVRANYGKLLKRIVNDFKVQIANPDILAAQIVTDVKLAADTVVNMVVPYIQTLSHAPLGVSIHYEIDTKTNVESDFVTIDSVLWQ